MRTAEQIMGNLSPTEFAVNCMDFKFFCERVLDMDLQPFHLEWIQLVQKHKRVAIQAPTGFGKTQVLGRGFCLWTAFLQRDKEMCIVSKTLPQARKVLSEIKDLVENNEVLAELIPLDKPKGTWCSADMMDTSTNCKIFVRPYSENIKGIHVDYLLGDEVSSYDDHTIWFRFVVTRVNAKNGTVVAISTPENVADLMQELITNSEYEGKSYPAIVEGKSIWANKFSIERLTRIKSEIGIAAFEREYMCNAKAQSENALYPPHLLVECFDNGTGFTQTARPGLTIIGCDFAIAEGPRADYDSYVVVNKFGSKATILYGETHRGFTIAGKIQRLKELYNIYSGGAITLANENKSGEVITPINVKFIIDPSGVGNAVLEELRAMALPVECAAFDASNRNAMLINLRRMIENKDLIIPRHAEDAQCMNFTDKLVREMISMVETSTKSKVLTYQAKSVHDDILMSLAMACKGIASQREFIDLMAF